MQLAGQAVVKIEPDVHQVHLHNGDVISYDKLLLATGGSARRLPDLDALNQQVYTLRTLEDAQALIQVLQPNRRIILIGGGVIGLELASSARAKDCQVTLLVADVIVFCLCTADCYGILCWSARFISLTREDWLLGQNGFILTILKASITCLKHRHCITLLLGIIAGRDGQWSLSNGKST